MRFMQNMLHIVLFSVTLALFYHLFSQIARTRVVSTILSTESQGEAVAPAKIGL